MPADLNTLGALITEVKHTMAPRRARQPLIITDAAGYLRMTAGSTSVPAGQVPGRLPTEQDLATLLAHLAPRPRPGSGDPNVIAAGLENAVIGHPADVIAGVNAIGQLAWFDIWAVVDRLASRGPTLDGQTYLELVDGVIRDAPNVDANAHAAILAELLRRGGRTVSTGTITGWLRLTMLLNGIEPVPQLEILHHFGVPPDAAEGAIAMMLAESYEAGLDMFSPTSLNGLAAGTAERMAMASGPLDWFPRLAQLLRGIDTNANTFLDFVKPANLFYGLYMGTAVHTAIAAYYLARHLPHAIPGTTLWTNTSPIQSILGALEAKYAFQGSPLSVALALARPDIFELGFVHGMPPGWVYEIKPATSGAATASYEATFYAVAMSLTGIPVLPGPVTAAGVDGVVPVPHGWAAFCSPQEGVIVYRVRYASREAIARRNQVTANKAVRDTVERVIRESAPSPAQVATAGMVAVIIAAIIEYGWVLAL